MTLDDWPEVRHTEVDGVRTVRVDVPGPLRAGLLVRVGRVDETFLTSGICHVLEHLALHGVGRPGDHANGQVDATTTLFHTTGDADSVRDFLVHIARGLADPPTDRLDDERGVLAAERAGRGPHVAGLLAAWRWGARGYGLTPQDEVGITRISAEDLRAWSARYATKGNSVLWISGPPPAGLRLALPDGGAVLPPDPRPSVLPELPAWFTNDHEGGIALHALLERGWASSALQHVLQSRLVDELRVRRAMAYSPAVDYTPLAGDVGQLLVVSDLVAGRATDGVRAFLDVVTELAGDRRPTEEETAEWLAAVRRQAQEPLAPLGFAAAQAFNLVTGFPVSTHRETEAGFTGVTASDIVTAARAAVASSVLAVPHDVELTPRPWVRAPLSVHQPVEGRMFVRVETGWDGYGLTVGDAGATHRFEGGQVTVRADRAVAVQHWADGRRVLVGDDGSRLDVEPTLWSDGSALVARIDAVFPSQLRVDMGSRPPDAVPQPSRPPVPVAPPPPRSWRRLTWGTWFMLAVAVVLVAAGISRVFGGPGVPPLVAGIWTFLALGHLRQDLEE